MRNPVKTVEFVASTGIQDVFCLSINLHNQTNNKVK